MALKRGHGKKSPSLWDGKMLYYILMERQREKLIRYAALAVTAFLAVLGLVLFLAMRGEERLEVGFALPRPRPRSRPRPRQRWFR